MLGWMCGWIYEWIEMQNSTTFWKLSAYISGGISDFSKIIIITIVIVIIIIVIMSTVALRYCVIIALITWSSNMDTSHGVLVLPGAEQPPSKYTIDVYVICDYYCYENIGTLKSNREEFLYDVIYYASRILGQLGVTLEVARMEIWNSYGWTNWTTPTLNPNYFYDVMDGMMDGERMKSSPYFDDVILFTGSSLTTGSTSGPSNIRAIHTVGTIGRPGSKGVLSINKFANTNLLALTLAHEIGHGLNMLHDTPGCSCPAGTSNCIMEAVGTPAILAKMKFSNCSMDRYNSWISGVNNIPLNKHYAPSTSQMWRSDLCGNGNVDQGEECDCGPECTSKGTNNCCKNCKFQPGAVCAGGPCCTSTCKFKSSGTKCRSSRDQTCDQDDVCTGNSEECVDKQASDWTNCKDDAGMNGYCKGGYCNTINAQCQTVFNREYSGCIDGCYNARNIPSGVEFKSNLSHTCQYLICNKNGSKQPVHSSRKSQTFISAGKQCTIGQYLPAEVGLLGMEDGWIEVEDGTRCGLSSACFHGRCLPLGEVQAQMNSSETNIERKRSLCGNGKLDAGEECDCSPLQCPCCNMTSCKFLPASTPCMGVCGVCTGNSKECTESSNPASNFRQCSGSFDKLCYNGHCVSALQQCQSHFFPWSRTIDGYSLKNVGQSSKLFNSGGYYVIDHTNAIVSESYVAGEDDGQCGILHCTVSTPDDDAVDWDAAKDPRQVFSVELANTGWIKVKYYNKVNRTVGGQLQRIFYPLLVDDGTPCFLPNKVLGYCKTETLTSSTGVQHSHSKCTKI